jgi:hypothetical protein
MRRFLFPLAIGATALAGTAAAAERATLTGELIDTWCYYSGVMGGYDSILGTAHHTCALWCAAGGVPVGLLTDDGDVYMVLKLEGADPLAEPETLLTVASDRLTVDGLVYERDGMKYIVVEEVVENAGVAVMSHDDFGPVPPFAIPDPNE